MARAGETAMCVAILGLLAFSLQGCGSAAEAAAHLQGYKDAAAAKVQEAKSAATTAVLKKSGACPPLHAAVNPIKADLISTVAAKVTDAAACKVDLKGTECGTQISFDLADQTMFMAEKDPKFVEWMGDHKGKWDNVKSSVASVLQGDLVAPVTLMQNKIEAGTDIASEGFSTFLKAELKQVIEAVFPTFCPATDEEIAAAESTDKLPLAAAGEAAKAAGLLKEEALKDELKAEAAGVVLKRRLVDDIAV